jgi:hypothetical protein
MGNNFKEGGKVGLVHAPHFPFPKKEAWSEGNANAAAGGATTMGNYAHRPFNLPYLEKFADMITINRKFQLPTQK